MRPLARARIVAVGVIAANAFAANTRADAAPVGGNWQAGATSMEVTVESWGTDCGPRPQSMRSSGGGNVKVEQQGQVLIVHGRERDVRSDQCWSPNVALRRVSTSYADGTWITRCKTGPQDPREEVGTYTLKLQPDGGLLYQDVSHFNWKLNASTCVATITTTQTLHKLTGNAAAAPETVPKAKPEPPAPWDGEPEPKTACTPGKATRVSLRPHRAEIGLGQRYCFSARVLDAKGCPLKDAELKWTLEHPRGLRGRLKAGCFEAGESSAESEGMFKVLVAYGTRRAEATVVVSVESLQALLAKRLEAGAITGDEAAADAGEAASTKAPAAAPAASTRVAARAVSEAEPGANRRWLIALAAALAAIAGGSLLLRRSSPRTRASTPSSSGNAPALRGGAPKARMRRCPKCGESYPETSAFCGNDGSALSAPE